MRPTLAALLTAALCAACAPDPVPAAPPASDYPLPGDPARVGSWPAWTKSGAGYFYDEVLEYRVWVHAEKGEDRFRAFATFEEAKAYSERTPRAEEPLVLVRQWEHVNEPEPGHYVHEKGERITEWRVEWLESGKRGADSIREFLESRKWDRFKIPRPESDERLSWEVIARLWEQADFSGDEETWESSVAQATAGQLAIYACTWYLREVRNGGHRQFFGNSAGMVWEEALAGFERLGAKEHRRILLEALAVFPGSRPAKDRSRRQAQLARAEPLGGLDNRLYDSEEDFESLAKKHILAHPEEFFLNR